LATEQKDTAQAATIRVLLASSPPPLICVNLRPSAVKSLCRLLDVPSAELSATRATARAPAERYLRDGWLESISRGLTVNSTGTFGLMAIVAVIVAAGGGVSELKAGRDSAFQNPNWPQLPEWASRSRPSSSRAPTKARRSSGA